MRLTLSTVKAAVANSLNLKTTDSRVKDYINRAQERLIYMGKWVGTTVRYRVCVNNACLTWPRQIETIEAWALCDRPGSIRNGWYEFLGSGPGILESTDCAGHTLIDRGNGVAFDDVVGDDKKLQIYNDLAETTTEKMILQFSDENGNWVRTVNDSGDYIDGEELTVTSGAPTYTTTSNFCSAGSLVRVIKPVTNGTIRLYEYDTVAGTRRPLAYYESDETIPEYRKSIVPGLSCSSNGDCEYCTVDVMAKLRHIPVINDNDFLIIEHAEAFRLACQAIRMEEANQAKEAADYWVLAKDCLEDQLSHWQGAGVTIPLRVENSATFGAHVTTLM